MKRAARELPAGLVIAAVIFMNTALQGHEAAAPSARTGAKPAVGIFAMLEELEPVIPEEEWIPPTRTRVEEILQTAKELRQEELEKKKEEAMTQDEDYVMAKLIMAEAEGEPLEGKALVGNVINNRVKDKRFPDSTKECIFESGQFSCITDGRYDSVEPDSECYKALEMVKNGWDKSRGALYYERSDLEDSWQQNHLTFLFSLGNHSFYK